MLIYKNPSFGRPEVESLTSLTVKKIKLTVKNNEETVLEVKTLLNGMQLIIYGFNDIF